MKHEARDPSVTCLGQEDEQGNVEYKLRLKDPHPVRLQQLVRPRPGWPDEFVLLQACMHAFARMHVTCSVPTLQQPLWHAEVKKVPQSNWCTAGLPAPLPQWG